MPDSFTMVQKVKHSSRNFFVGECVAILDTDM